MKGILVKLEPGPLGSRPYLVKVPGGLSGKLNKKCKNALLQCSCSKPVYHMRKSVRNETQKPPL